MTKTMTTYIILGIIAIIAIVIFNNYSKKSKSTNGNLDVNKPEQNPYLDLRSIAFSSKAEELGLKDIDDDKVYGMIAEMDMNPGTMSVVSFLTGDTSLYLSSGGGFIGAGQHEEVNKIIKEKVDGFQKYLLKAEKIEKPEFPKEGMANFNFITRNGIYSVSEKISELESGKSELSNLFGELNEIITQIRLKSD